MKQDAETPIKQDEEAIPQAMVDLVQDIGEPNRESTVMVHHSRTCPPMQVDLHSVVTYQNDDLECWGWVLDDLSICCRARAISSHRKICQFQFPVLVFSKLQDAGAALSPAGMQSRVRGFFTAIGFLVDFGLAALDVSTTRAGGGTVTWQRRRVFESCIAVSVWEAASCRLAAQVSLMSG